MQAQLWSTKPGGLSRLRRPRGASSAAGPGWQCHCWLMDRFPMRVLCRLPAVLVQVPDQHGCTAPHHSRMGRNWETETSHLRRTAINLCNRQADDGPGEQPVSWGALSALAMGHWDPLDMLDAHDAVSCLPFGGQT